MEADRNDPLEIRTLIEEATFAYTMGDHREAIAQLTRALDAAPQSAAAWHALSEVHLDTGDLDQALSAGEKAHALRPDDLFINTTLSRIWVRKGDKAQAEKFNAQAKILGWKEDLKNPPSAGDLG
ncbi:MAG: tetratricopeptide repeat protein [Puniceicoccaceae bacterium]|nr:MAG: tetratricopeptide repeat protein [Puniceicoccaceae bacterium]